jgi:hypothetical protein
MQSIFSVQYHHTSVTLRPASKRRFRAGLLILKRNGVLWSESELLRRLAKMYLRHWRGRGVKSATARRYNHDQSEKYVRMAWYIDKVLYSVLWERAIHSGESVSRMLDFAIRHYLPRLLEEYLRSAIPGMARSARNAPYWKVRFERRYKPQAEIFITYRCSTEKNDHSGLTYRQEALVLRKSELLNPGFPAKTQATA